jgi:hypothetical protein
MISVKWRTCGDDGHWCSFDNLNLSGINVFGVYVIWHEGNPGRVVRVGQGDVAERLQCHRGDAEVTAHRKSGTLRVTWAAVPAAQVDGVERYLADTWSPLVGDRWPDVLPIAVNSPWS